MQRVRNFGNRVSRPGMSETQRGVKLNFRNRLEIGLRDFMEAEETYRIRSDTLRRMALKAK